MTEVHLVLPNDIDDSAQPSGGNVYDRRICRGLTELGWRVHEHAMHGAWPHPGEPEHARVAGALAKLPDNAIVLLDGMVAAAIPDVLSREAGRLRLIGIVHMPFGDETADLKRSEGAALAAMTAVVTTSSWTRRRLLDLYALPGDRVHVAAPGVDSAPLAPGSEAGAELLCVAAVTPRKGQDVLTRALATIADLPWNCVCVGALSRDPPFVERVRQLRRIYGLLDRMTFVGPRTGGDLDASYAAADLMILPSLGESYGMVVTEALARGIPVVATEAKGMPEALGRAPDGTLPGILIRPGDPAALAGALRRWLGDGDLRRQLRGSAQGRRAMLSSWAVPSDLVSGVLTSVTA